MYSRSATTAPWEQPSREWQGELLEIFHLQVLTKICHVTHQPRAGCSVCAISSHVRLWQSPFHSMPDPLLLRAPVVQITANATTTSPSSKATSHTGAIAGGIAGGVAALILVVGTIAFVRRRRRQDDFRKSAGSSFSGTVIEGQMTVTPFNPTLTDAVTLQAGSQIWTASDGPSSTSEPLLPPARSATPIPVGLNSKELARLRSAAMFSLPTHAPSSSSGSQPTYPPPISATEGSTVTPIPETQRLQTEVESLRREMQELRAERFEAPPSYGDGGGV